MPPTNSPSAAQGAQPHQAKSTGSTATTADSADLRTKAQQDTAKKTPPNSQPVQPNTTVLRLEEIAKRTGALSGPESGKNSGPYKIDAKTNTAIKVWYTPDGKVEKYEHFKLDTNGNPVSSRFYSVKGGELKVAKDFSDKAKPNGVQVNLQLKDIKEAHRELKAVGNEGLTALQKLANDPRKDHSGYIQINNGTGFKAWNNNGVKQYELIDNQANKSYFYDAKGKLLFEKDLSKKSDDKTAIKKAAELSPEAQERLQKKLEAVNHPKPQGASDTLFHSDGREISAETKKAAQTINGSMKSWLRGGNDDATFFKTFEGLSDEKRQDLVDAYKQMYKVDLREKVKQEFWGDIRRERAEALVTGDKITAKSAELQQKINDSKDYWLFRNATKSRDAVGDVTRDLTPQEAEQLKIKHKEKYTDVRDQLGTNFSAKDQKGVESYYAGKQQQGDVYSLAAENERTRTYYKGRDEESTEKILNRHAGRKQEDRDKFTAEYKIVAEKDIKTDTRIGDFNNFRADRFEALIDGNKNKATAIKIAEQKKDGFSVDTLVETLAGAGKEKIKEIGNEYDKYVGKKSEGNGDIFKSEVIKAASTKEEKTELSYLVENGELDDSMKLVRATRGLGTEDEIVKEIIERNKADKLQGLDAKLKLHYGAGADVDGIIAEEISQKSDLRFDYEEARNYGDPKTPEDQMAAVDRRYQRENANRSWVVDNWWSQEDAQNFDESYKLSKIRYQEYATAKETGSNLEIHRTSGNLNNSYQSYLESENTYRTAREEAADSVASGAATVAAVGAATVVTVASGGTLAPIAVGLLATGSSAVASFGTRYAVRKILEGDSYTWEEIGSDGASAAIDGIASATGAKIATAATGKIAVKAVKGAETIVSNGVEGGLSGAATATSERRFWNGISSGNLSESMAMIANGAMLGAATNIAIGAATDLGSSGLGKLKRDRGGDDGGGGGNVPDNDPPPSSNSPPTQPSPATDTTDNLTDAATQSIERQASVSNPTELSNVNQTASGHDPAQIHDEGDTTDYSSPANHRTTGKLSTTTGNGPSGPYSTQQTITENRPNTGSLPQTATPTGSLNSNPVYVNDGVPVQGFPEEVSDQFKRVSRTTSGLNLPSQDTSPLETQHLRLSRFKKLLYSKTQVIDSNVPGRPNGIHETGSLGLYVNSHDIADSDLPYPAYAMKREGNSFEEIKEKFDLESFNLKTKLPPPERRWV